MIPRLYTLKVLLIVSGITTLSLPAQANDLKLFEVEGRAGAFGFRDYEFAIGPNGADHLNTGIIYQDWQDNTPVNWCIQWNQASTTASFFLTETAGCNATPITSTITYDSPTTNLPFNKFTLVAYAHEIPGVVEAGTTMTLVADTYNLTSLLTDPDYTLTATAGTTPLVEFTTGIFNPVITSLSGTATINWTTIDPNQALARSAVGFKIKGFDPPGSVLPEAENVPEPSTAAALIVAGSLLFLRSRQREK